MIGTIPLLPLSACVACYRVTFTFTFLCSKYGRNANIVVLMDVFRVDVFVLWSSNHTMYCTLIADLL